MRSFTHRLFASVRPLIAAALLTPLLAQATMVRMYTTLGPIDVNLLDSAAPISVQNFLAYVDAKSYDGTFIHRAPKNFVVQGGGYTINANGAQHIPTRPQIQLECSLDRPNARGTIAMARTQAANTATSEWFVNTSATNSFLNCTPGVAGYAVFGRVTTPGMATADAIAGLPVVPSKSVPWVGGQQPNITFTDLPLLTIRPTTLLTDYVYVTSAVRLPARTIEADRVFDAMEGFYWQFLKPSGVGTSMTAEAGGVTYYFRYYPASGSYIGMRTNDNVVVYLVPELGPNLVPFATVADLMPAVSAAGY